MDRNESYSPTICTQLFTAQCDVIIIILLSELNLPKYFQSMSTHATYDLQEKGLLSMK